MTLFRFSGNSRKEIADKLSDRYDIDEINEACDEIQTLKDGEVLFTEDIYEPCIEQFAERKAQEM